MKEGFKYVNASQEALVIKYTDSFAIIEVVNVIGDESSIFINKIIAKKLIESLKGWAILEKDAEVAKVAKKEVP